MITLVYYGVYEIGEYDLPITLLSRRKFRPEMKIYVHEISIQHVNIVYDTCIIYEINDLSCFVRRLKEIVGDFDLVFDDKIRVCICGNTIKCGPSTCRFNGNLIDAYLISPYICKIISGYTQKKQINDDFATSDLKTMRQSFAVIRKFIDCKMIL
jgi:hypothetical protein